jgi:hypothetical protein
MPLPPPLTRLESFVEHRYYAQEQNKNLPKAPTHPFGGDEHQDQPNERLDDLAGELATRLSKQNCQRSNCRRRLGKVGNVG